MMSAILKITLFTLFFSSSLLSYDLKEVQKRGELRHLGIPYANFVTGSGDGLDVEVMQGFAKYLKVKYTFVPTTWTDVYGDLTGQNARNSDNGVEFLNKVRAKGDVVANGLTILDWRKKIVNYSTPTFPSGVWLVARADSKLKPIKPSASLSEDISSVKSNLSGVSVLAIKNTCVDPRLYNMKSTKAEIRLQSQNLKLNELVPAILNNNAETTLLDVPDALIALEKWSGEIKVIGPISQKQEMGVAFRKDSPLLLEAFNSYFEQIKKDGSYNKLVEKYYPDVFYYYSDFFNKK